MTAVRRAGWLATALLAACGGGGSGASRAGEAPDTAAADTTGSRMQAALETVVKRSGTLADSIRERLQPVELLRPAQKAALRRYSNADNLARARRLGVRARDEAELEQLVGAGRLVKLEDGGLWVVRDLESSRPYVTPAAKSLLERIGGGFQRRLREMGLPPYRMEITSALRTAADQAALRRTNVNAAAGASAHEYGTTVDVAYSGYAAPLELPGPVADAIEDAPRPARPWLEAVARRTLERVAARKSRELEAVLADAMRQAQSRGEVLVTLERLQPVFHITVNR